MKASAFYSHICDCLTSCQHLMALLGPEDPVRRVDRPDAGTFGACICYGRLFGAPIPGFESEPVQNAFVTFTPYVRVDYSDTMAGDIYLGEILYWLKRRFGCARCDFDCCTPGSTSEIIIMNSRWDGDLDEPACDTTLQAWHQSVRYMFKVTYQCCRPGQPEFCF
jgi:hypothetical protein